MKCPLFKTRKRDAKGRFYYDQADCLKEECAWWDTGKKCCVVYSLYHILADCIGYLGEIKRNMPVARE